MDKHRDGQKNFFGKTLQKQFQDDWGFPSSKNTMIKPVFNLKLTKISNHDNILVLSGITKQDIESTI